MRTKYHALQEAPSNVIHSCLCDVGRPASTSELVPQQCCPLLTRARLMTALGVSLIATILLLLQCVPGLFHPEYCCTVGGASVSGQVLVTTAGSPNINHTADDSDSDIVFIDASTDPDDVEYDGTAEGGDRIHYKHTKRQQPQCIIIGVRKGGTRALLEFLSLHPGIQAQKQEMHFFDDDDNYSLGLDWYRKKMPFSYADQVTIEKTPAYFVEDGVPQRLHSMNSSIKLLLVVRDPVDRTLSDYMQIHSSRLAKGRYHESFGELVLDQDTGQIDKNYKPIRRSIYYRHMERWLRYFDLSQFHLVSAENLVRDPVAELNKVETFLGLEHRLSRDNFYFNQTKGFYCISLDTDRTRKQPGMAGQPSGGQRHKCLAPSKGRDHQTIRPALLQQLTDFFRPLNSKFYDMVGINFGWRS